MREMPRPRVLLLLVLVAGIGATPLPHTELEESSPADGAVLAESPASIRLLFNRAVDAGLATVTLRGPAGTEHELEPTNEEGEPRAVVSTAPPLGTGTWVVSWRVVADDGHPVTGTFSFRVEAQEPSPGDTGALGDPAAGGADEGVRPGPDTSKPGGGAPGTAEATGPDVRAVAVRGFAGAVLLGLAGLLTFVVLGRSTLEGGGAAPAAIRAAGWLAPPLLAGHLWIWWSDLVPAGRAALDPGLLLGTTAGTLEVARLGLALLALGALLVTRSLLLPALLAWGAVLAGAALGHPLTSAPLLAVPAKAVHLAAAGVWAGGLLYLVTLRPEDDGFLSGVSRVSGSALWASVGLAGSGVLMALLFLERPGDLVATSYGLLLLGKVAGMAGLVALGALNRFRLLPRLPEEEAAAALHRSVAVEVGLMAAVFLVAAALASTPPGG